MKIRYPLTLCLLIMPLAALAMPMHWHESKNFYSSAVITMSNLQTRHADYSWLYIQPVPEFEYKLLNGAQSEGNDGYRLLTVAVKSLRSDFYLQSSGLWPKGRGKNKPGIVAEPGTMVLLSVGLVSLVLARRKILP